MPIDFDPSTATLDEEPAFDPSTAVLDDAPSASLFDPKTATLDEDQSERDWRSGPLYKPARLTLRNEQPQILAEPEFPSADPEDTLRSAEESFAIAKPEPVGTGMRERAVMSIKGLGVEQTPQLLLMPEEDGIKVVGPDGQRYDASELLDTKDVTPEGIGRALGAVEAAQILRRNKLSAPQWMQSKVVKDPTEAAEQEELSRWENARNAFGRGALGGIISAVQATAKLDEMINERMPTHSSREIIKARQAMLDEAQKAVRMAYPMDPRYRDEFIASDLPSGAGSILPFVLSGSIGGPIASAALGSLMSAQSEYEAARAAGMDEETARKSFGVGALIGATEAFGAGRKGARVGKGSAVRELLAGANEEGAQEALQQFLSNVNAIKFTGYDMERNPMNGVLKGYAVGAILGGAVKVPGIAAERIAQIRQSDDPEAELEQELENANQLEEPISGTAGPPVETVSPDMGNPMSENPIKPNPNLQPVDEQQLAEKITQAPPESPQAKSARSLVGEPEAVTEEVAPTPAEKVASTPSPQGLSGPAFVENNEKDNANVDAYIDSLEPGIYEVVDSDGEVSSTIEVSRSRKGKNIAFIVGAGEEFGLKSELIWNRQTNADGSTSYTRSTLRKAGTASTTEATVAENTTVQPVEETAETEDVSPVTLTDEQREKVWTDAYKAAQDIANQVTQGQGDTVREAAQMAAIKHAERDIDKIGRFRPYYMRLEAKQVANDAVKESGEDIDKEDRTPTDEEQDNQTPAVQAKRAEHIELVRDALSDFKPEEAEILLASIVPGGQAALAKERGVEPQAISNKLARLAPKFRAALAKRGITREDAISVGPGAANMAEFAPQKTTGLKRAVVDQERLLRGAEPIPTAERQSEKEAIQRAEDKIDENPMVAPALIARLVDTSDNSLTRDEAALLLVERARLKNLRSEYEAVLGREDSTPEEKAVAEKELVDIEEKMDRIDRAQRAGGTAWGRLGHMYQRMIREDFTLEAMERKARAAKQGPLSKAELATIKEQNTKLEALEKKIADLEAKQEADQVKATFQALIREVKKEAKAAAKEGKSLLDTLKAGRDDALKSLRSKMGRSSAGVDPTILYDVARIGAYHIANGAVKLAEFTAKIIADVGEWIRPNIEEVFESAKGIHDANKSAFKTPGKKNTEKPAIDAAKESAAAGNGITQQIVFDLAREKVRSGVTELDAVMAAVHNDLAKIFPGVTVRDIRDAFSGYGKVNYPSKEADLTKLRELRRLAQLASAIEDAQKKVAPKKTGMQRDQPTQAIRDKTKELQKVMREQGIETSSPEAQLKSANAARATALRNQIEDLDRQLRTGEKTPKSPPIPDSPEVERLRAERDAMKEELKRIEAEENPGKSEEEIKLDQAVKAAQKSISRLDEMIKSGLLSRPEKPLNYTVPTEVEAKLQANLEALRSERDAMRDFLNELRKDARPKKSEEERAIQALEKSIAEYERRMNEVDLSPRAKKHGPDTERVAGLKRIREAAKEAYQKLVKAQQVVRTEEEVRLARDKKNIQRQIEKLQERIADGDYAPQPRKEPLMDAEKQKLLFEKEQLRKQFFENLFQWKLANQTLTEKITDKIAQTLGLLRAVRGSLDFGAFHRQGGFLVRGNPAMGVRNLGSMLKAMKSERGRFDVMEEIRNRDNYKNGLYQRAKLYIAEEGEAKLSRMEEEYMSRWAKHVPGIAASERGHVTFLNKLRADAFDAFVASLSKTGDVTTKEAEAIASFVNITTGRGFLGRFQSWLPAANSLLYATSYYVSRLQLMFAPLTGMRFYGGTSRTRRLIAKEYAKSLTGLALWYSMLALAASTFLKDDEKEEVKIETDPRSSDFGKVRFGQTRIDPMMGMAQFIVVSARTITGETKNEKGVRSLVDNVKFGKDDMADVLGRFIRSKLSPNAAMAWDIKTRYHYGGERTTPLSVAEQMLPMSIGEVYESMRSHGVSKGTALMMLLMLGDGVMTYNDNPGPLHSLFGVEPPPGKFTPKKGAPKEKIETR